MHVPYLPRLTRLPVLRLYRVVFCPIKGLTSAAAATAAAWLFGAFCFVGTAAGQSNSPPVIAAVEPGFCVQDRAITPFSISVSDPDGDDVTVTVTGLPPGLSFSNGQVSGTPMADLPLIPPNEGRDYTVTIKADDGVNTAVTTTFTYSVRWGQARITVPDDRTYKRGEEIAAFGITIEIDENSGIVAVTGLPPGLSWSDGQVKGTVSATAEARDYTVTISADHDGATGWAPKTATFKITVSAPAVTIADASAAEGDAITFTVTLDQAVSGGFSVTPGFAGGTAAKGTDYTANTAALAFAGTAGETKSFTVSTTEDAVVEPDETFTVSLSVSGTTETVSVTGTATGTINDDDTAAVTIADASASEGDAITFTVSVDNAVAGGFDVTPSFAGGTATKGTDYTENTSALSFTGTAGESRTFTVATTEDADNESNETFTVSLSVSGTSLDVSATGTATGTIANDDAPALTIADASAAEGDEITFTVTLDQAVSGGLTVTPGFTGGTATEGTDYSANAAGVTFTGTAGETRTFTVSTTEDEVVEHDETFNVSLSVSDAAETVTATDTATGTITNDDNATVTVAAVSGAEGGSGYSFTVNGNLYTEVAASATLDKAVQGGFRLFLRATAGTATIDPDGNSYATSDFGATTVSLSFAGSAGEKQSLDRNWVAIHQDEIVEGPETFNIAYSLAPLPGEGPVLPPVPSAVTVSGPSTGTINDDDTATLTIEDASASEGDGITFTVSVDKAVASGFDVTPSYAGGTATKGTDYTENTASVGFTGTAGETQTFTVSTTEDEDNESDETFTVSLSVSNAAGTVKATDTATGTITDDDYPAVTIADASASEGDAITFTVTLDAAVSGGLTVTPGFSGGTAAKGTDYTVNTAALTFTGTANEKKTFTVSTTEDEVVEHDETFTVSLSVSEAAETVTATDTATGTITNDDNATVTVAAVSGAEGGSGYSFTVNGNLYTEVAASATLDKAVQGGFRLFLRATAGTATIDPDGNSYATSDFGATTVSLSFAGNAGETQSLDRNWVAIYQDELVEGPETFNIAYQVGPLPGEGPLPQVPSALTVSGPATGTINDDDTATVTIADSSAAEGDPITFTVAVDKAVQGGFDVTPSYAGGTATKGTDYTANTASVSFTGSAGETQTFTVATAEDADNESDETFTVSLSVSNAAGTVQATNTATGTITDDDFPAVTIADASAAEGDAITFTVTLDAAVSGGLTVTPGFTGGTATKGTDYTANAAALTFTGTANEKKTFTVSTAEDQVVEHDETFTVSLSVSGTTETVTATDTAEGTITNDDNATVTVAAVSGAEGGSGYSFTVNGNLHTEVAASATLDRAVQGGFRLFLRATAGTATIDPDGNSYATSDFGATTVSLSFAGNAGETQSLDRNWVAIYQDEIVEGPETFNIAYQVGPLPGEGPLPQVPSALTVSGPATGTINDDDTATVTIADSSAAEGDPITFRVAVDKAVQGGFDVTPSYAGGTATKGTDYTANTSAVTFTGTAGETQTFTVATTEDADVEPDETFTVSLSVSNTAGTFQATNTATGTITDDDFPAVTIADASAAEGDAITFTVTLDAAVSGGLTVTPGFTGGTATKGTDYTANAAALTFTGTANEKKTFTVSTAEDQVVEHDETFTVGLTVSGTTETVTATDTAEGTITNDDNATVTVGTVSGAEGGSGYSFRVNGNLHTEVAASATLDKAVQGGFRLYLKATAGTATKDPDGNSYSTSDFGASTVSLSFTGNARETQSLDRNWVAIYQDEIVEGPETFNIAYHLGPLPGEGPLPPVPDGVTVSGPATGTINDDDSATVTIADSSAAEGDPITFRVAVDKAVQGGFAVTPGFSGGTATKGTDYTENTAAVNFTGTADETQTFTVATTEDAAAESDETFTVSLTVSGAAGTVEATDTATGTITNDDAPALTIEDESADEGDAITFTVTLDAAVTGGLTVTPAFTDGTATKGTDYTENTAALSFTGTAGETRSFTVATTEDAKAEPDETFTVSLTVSGASETVTATDTAEGTINNDDAPAVTIEDRSADEGDAITFTVTLDAAVSGGLTVTPGFAGGTAAKGTDYTQNTAALAFTGTAGETKSFDVATAEDEVVEADETFTVSLSVSGTTETITATDTAEGTINNDDTAVLTIEDASAEEGDEITFTVAVDKAVADGFNVTPGFAGGTATKGADYTENTAAISFTGSAGETQSFTVATTEDEADEANETFTVSLTLSGTSLPVTATDTAEGTITNDDNPAVTIEDASAEEGDAITFTVTLDKAVSGGLTVTPGFTDGTATKGTDYTENTAALSFTGTAGETKSFTVATTDDDDDEPNETFTVSLTVSGASETVTATDTATGTINNDDAPALTIEDANADEGDGITFTVTLDQAVSGGLTVTPGFADGTATKGTDYTENTAALSFTGTAGETRSFTVATIQDAVVEADETFTVSLTVSGTTETVTATDTAEGTINNDDAPALTIEDANADEGDGIAFTVTLDQAVSGGLTVTPGFTGGTATKGTDYTENSAAITFAGTAQETQTFTVTTAEDEVVEADETFTVNLTVSGTTETVTATDTAVGTINNDDTAILTIEDASAEEGDEITFTVAVDKAVAGGFNVNPGFAGGTATKGTDYTENTAALSFTGTAGETETFTVATIDDNDDESDETFTVSMSVSGSSLPVTATDTAEGTITNDDDPAVTIENASAEEGEAITFTVTLDKAVSGGLTVTPGFTDGTAAKGTDYTENTAALSFTGTAGETKTFTVTTTEDALVEDDETFTVSLSVSGAAETVTATDTAEGSITNDDDPALTIEDASAEEGEAITFTVTLNAAVSGGLTVTPGFTDGTAAKDTDYTENTTALNFTGTEGESLSFTVATAEDEVVEADMGFVVSLSVSGNSETVTTTGTATGTIINDDTAIVTIADASASEGGGITFTVAVDKAVAGGFTVTPGFSGGTATKGTDYAENTAAIPFAGTAGETRSFTVATTEDEDEEPNETFTVSMSVSGTTLPVTATGTAEGTITDDDGSNAPGSNDGGTVYVSVDEPEDPVEEGLTVELPVRITESLDGTVQVPWSSSVPAPASKISVAESESKHEHEPSSGTITLAAGQLEAIIEIIILDDEEHEDLESFQVKLGEPSVASEVSRKVSLDRRTATVTILDNDAPPVFDEGDTAIRFVVENTPPGTDVGGPFLATDAENDPLSFALGGADASAFTLDPDTGQLRTKEPLDFETRNTYDGLTVTVDDGHGHTDILYVTVNVTDASPPDAPDAPAVVRSSSDPESSLDVSWNASADNGSLITDYDVRYRKSGTTEWKDHAFDGAATGTAIASLTAASTYEVQVLARNAEGDGQWSDSGRGATLDPSSPGETVMVSDASAAEGEVLSFNVRLNLPVPGGLTVTPGFRDGTAVRGQDYTANVTGIRFTGTAGETHAFTVATTEDEIVEYDETFTVSLDISGTSATGVTTDTATGTIADDDGGTVRGIPTVTIGDAGSNDNTNANGGTAATGNRKASEGDGMTFRVTLNRAVQGGLTLRPVFTDGTATSGIDFTPYDSPLRFGGTAGETRTFTVATIEDDEVEENETFTVGLRVSDAPSGVTVGNTVTGTIIDDDGRNEHPVFDVGASTTRTVVENTPAGGPVGDPVAATDANGDILSYTLSGSDAFAIDSETGQITVSEGASLNYETGPLSYAVTVAVNDGRDGNDVIEVAISVTDEAEPPAAPAAPRVTGASLESVRVDWRPPANTGPDISDYDVRYRLQGAAEWTSHAFTGTQTVSKIPGLEPDAAYEAQVRAKNAEGTGAWSAAGSGRTRVNTAPVAVDDVVTVFRGRRTTSLRNGNGGVNGPRNPSVTPPEDFDIPEPDAGAKIAPLANSVAATETDDGHISVLANDVDAEDDWNLLTAILVEAPAHGTLTLYENGTFIYTHDGSRAAEDRFTYRVLDSRGAGSDEATVTILITGVNLGPAVTGTIPDQVLTMGTNGRVDLTGLFVDPDGDPLTYEASSDLGIVNVSLVDGVIALTPVAAATTRVTVTARDPYGLSAKLSFAVRVENLETNRARVLELSLAAFGRTVLSQAVDAIAGRFEATSRALRATLDGSRLVLGQTFNALDWVQVAARLFGIPLDVPVSRSAIGTAAPAGLPGVTSDPITVAPSLRVPSGRSILTRSSFQMAMDRPGTGGNGWTLWGRGAGSRYSGSNNRLDGEVAAAYVGADYHWDSKLVLGLAASYSDGVQDFDNAGASTGEWRTRLTSLRPYLHWSPTEKIGLWGMLGFGRGEAELYSGYGGPLTGTGSSSVVTDIGSRSAALGGRMDLTRVGNVDLALTADAFVVSTSSEAVAGLRATTGNARRVRMMVNGSTGWSVTPDTRMDLSLGLGARLDGGDVETGLGTELAGGLAVSDRRIGLDVEVRSHWLAAHQDRDFREAGLSLALRLDPGSDNRGLGLSLIPEWGENASGGVESLWKRDQTMSYRSNLGGRKELDWRPSRARTALGYKLETWGGRGRMEPFVELDVQNMGLHRLGGGLRLNVPRASDGATGAFNGSLRLELLGEYRVSGQTAAIGDSAEGGGDGDYRFGLFLFRDF